MIFSTLRSCFKGFIVLIFLTAFGTISSWANDGKFRNIISWSEIATIPPAQGDVVQHGLATPFAGLSNGMIIVAGGCNFPNTPVYEGGIKKYYDDIFVLDESAKDPQWMLNGKFPYPIAYGASVIIDEGIVYIGGKNIEKEFADVHLISWNTKNKKVALEKWPTLPFSMSNMAAAVVNHTIFVAGGTANGKLANKFLALDISKKGTDDFKWKELQDFPGPARVQPVAVAQNAAEEKHFYLFSGSSFPEGDENPTITTDGLEYNPKTKQWSNLSDINPENGIVYSLHGASGIPIGVHHMLFIGGVNRELFTAGFMLERQYSDALKARDSLQIKKIAQKKYAYLTHQPEWYHFNTDVLVYHTITDTWSIIDEYPYPGPAGAPIVKSGKNWYIINGETKPGVRSPKVYRGTENVTANFGALNWTLLLLYLAGMLYLGYFFMKRENGTEDFFKGGQRIPWWAAGMSLFATMLSAITFMAIPAKTYATDWRYFMMAITIFVMAIPVVKYYLPFFRRLKVTSAYEYLELRFNYTSRLLASTIFMVFMVARTALVLFLPSLALTTVTGIDIYICILLMGIITIIYCTMGGVEAVIWGDVIQGFVLLGGAIFALVFLISGTDGGLNKVIDITIEHEKMKTFDMAFSFTNATFWVVLLGGIANNLISYSSDQTAIQRYLTTKDEKSAGKSIYMNGIMSVVVSFLFYFIGTALFAYYKTNPDQLNVSMANPDSIFPHFIMTNIPQGIAGIMIAAIFAASMSTVSSSINSMSTAFTTDLYQKFIKHKTDRHYLSIARLSGIIMGGLGVGLALFMAMWNILSLFDYFNYILGLLASGLGGLFFMGIFFPSIKGRAAIIGFLGGFFTVLLVKMQTDIHLMLFGFIGMASSVVIGLLASKLIPEKAKSLEGLTIKSLNSKS